MAGAREVYPEELPRKRPKKDMKEEIFPVIAESAITSAGLNLLDEQPRVFEVRSGIRKDTSDAIKITLLEKSALAVIDKICEDHEIEKKGIIGEVMESAMKEFYSRIIDKINALQINKPEKVKFTSNPRAMIKEKTMIIHNQRKASDVIGAIKEVDLIKVLNTGKWKLRELPKLK